MKDKINCSCLTEKKGKYLTIVKKTEIYICISKTIDMEETGC